MAAVENALEEAKQAGKSGKKIKQTKVAARARWMAVQHEMCKCDDLRTTFGLTEAERHNQHGAMVNYPLGLGLALAVALAMALAVAIAVAVTLTPALTR